MDDPVVVHLLEQHLEHMHAITPVGSVHALDRDALSGDDIILWGAWEGGELLGCGALKALDAATGEIKSMRTATRHRGRGVASRLVEHIVATAQARGYRWLKLETGSNEHFAPARGLYERHGFTYCGPFGSYGEDPNSTFMVLALSD